MTSRKRQRHQKGDFSFGRNKQTFTLKSHISIWNNKYYKQTYFYAAGADVVITFMVWINLWSSLGYFCGTIPLAFICNVGRGLTLLLNHMVKSQMQENIIPALQHRHRVVWNHSCSEGIFTLFLWIIHTTCDGRSDNTWKEVFTSIFLQNI